MRPYGGHYIRKNDTSRIPRRHIIFDTETRYTKEGRTETQVWRCGVASFCEYTDKNKWRIQTREFASPNDLVAAISAFTRPKKRTVLWAHNLSFDLRISQALKLLVRDGWSLQDIRLASQGTWAKWRREQATLIAVDSVSVWPCSLDKLAQALGRDTYAYPRTDDDTSWLAKCGRDVEVLTDAVTRYLSWLRDDDMGTWQMTGAGQSWGAWRHKHYTHKILVADDLEARTAERRAMWTGRAEAWTHGTDETAMVYDLDFQNAYATIAREIQLPVRQAATARVQTIDGLLSLANRFCVLAELEVTTDNPVVPTERNGHVIWPVGTFNTTLWDPEIRLLADAGASVKVGNVWLYKKAPALRSWADWILLDLHSPDDQVEAWRKIILKHWSRTLIGRFAMKYQSWNEFAQAATDDLRIMNGYDRDEEAPFRLLQVGKQVKMMGDEEEGNSAVPAITGYVMSESRRRLWDVTQLIGQRDVFYIDTDSVLVSSRGYGTYRRLVDHPAMASLRLKRRFRGYSIAGPRQAIIGGETRISGLPKGSRRIAEWEFEGHVWRGFDEAIKLGEADKVTVTARTFRIMQVDNRRVRMPDGTTEPQRISDNGKRAV